jgi:hypothetical protein
VVAGLPEVLLKALLIRGFVGQGDVRRQIGLEFRFLGVCLVQPLRQLRIAFIEIGSHHSSFI